MVQTDFWTKTVMFMEGISSSCVSSLFVCILLLLLLLFVWFGFILHYYFYFYFKDIFSNHRPLPFSGLPAKALSLRHQELSAWQRLKDGWCALLLRSHLQRWSWSRGGSSHKTQLRPRWVWHSALLGQYTAWSLLLLIAKITYSLHYTSLTASHRCKKLPAS